MPRDWVAGLFLGDEFTWWGGLLSWLGGGFVGAHVMLVGSERGFEGVGGAVNDCLGQCWKCGGRDNRVTGW